MREYRVQEGSIEICELLLGYDTAGVFMVEGGREGIDKLATVLVNSTREHEESATFFM